VASSALIIIKVKDIVKITNWIRIPGKIKGQKITGKWYITEDNFKKYLTSNYPVPVK